jgi:hypothetical protein
MYPCLNIVSLALSKRAARSSVGIHAGDKALINNIRTSEAAGEQVGVEPQIICETEKPVEY